MIVVLFIIVVINNGDTIVDNYTYVSTLGKPSKENLIATQYEDKDIFLGGLFGAVNNLSTFCDFLFFVRFGPLWTLFWVINVHASCFAYT